MSLFLRLALRNIFRNRGRTTAALLTIAIGYAALIINGGVVFNIFHELREDAIHGRHGHLQIYRRGYSAGHLEEPERYLIAPDQAARILSIVRANPRVLQATRRREFSGLIGQVDRYVPFVGVGVEPVEDQRFASQTTLRAGGRLASGDPNSVEAGLGLARKLDGKIGDRLNLMTTTPSGALNAVPVRLHGIFEGGLKEYDDWTLKVPLPVVEHLLADDRTEQIVLLFRQTEEVPVARAELEAQFRREGLDVETRSWNELALFHNQVVSLFGRELDIVRLIVSLVVVLGISNAIAMSIAERRVELATLRALGLRARVISTLLLAEALLTGLIGGCLGLFLGIALARTITGIGIPYPSPPGSTRPFVGGVNVVPQVVVAAFLISIGATLAAAALPVWRTMKCPISPALRGA